MPGHIKKYSVRFSPKRIKKIMQRNTEIGRISMAVPVIISRALEIFLKSLLTETFLVTQSDFSSTVLVAHMRQCIESEKVFHFLRELAQRGKSAAAPGDKRGMNIWSFYREGRQEICVEKPSASAGVAARQMLDSLDTKSSSSESELYICL
ncbi:dr1-associated corepressor [Salarias fasciatus]|uniref:dr1-associated corepressor n=1 Tax=Salarias fasciatus TaxID=181472 RepID=UPI001176A18A|nr:dr1-associated corepressor-like [Salarias fasciatus]